MRTLVVCCFLLSVPASVLSQSSPRMISEVHVSTPKPGMTAQWEAGRKAHSAFHAATFRLSRGSEGYVAHLYLADHDRRA